MVALMQTMASSKARRFRGTCEGCMFALVPLCLQWRIPTIVLRVDASGLSKVLLFLGGRFDGGESAALRCLP